MLRCVVILLSNTVLVPAFITLVFIAPFSNLSQLENG
jgi:hypothetical protein